MKLILNTIYFIIFLLIEISQEDSIEIIVTAKTGIINKKLDKDKFSFEIECEVNKNITNNISKIGINIKVKEADDDGSEGKTALCYLEPVRVFEESSTTHLLCTIELDDFRTFHTSNEEINLITDGNPSIASTDLPVTFDFEDFDQISGIINIEGDLTLKYLDEDENYCNNNHFLFEIISSTDIKPLQSTICKVKLSDDKEHTEANCAIPFVATKIKCYVDVSQKKYVPNDNIIIKAQNLVPCQNGQNIELSNDATNKLIIKEECGEIINNKKNYIYIRELLFYILLFMII